MVKSITTLLFVSLLAACDDPPAIPANVPKPACTQLNSCNVVDPDVFPALVADGFIDKIAAALPAPVPGPKGEAGEQGPQGVQGAPGTDGAQGTVGPQGVAGLVGPQGIQGFQGPQGVQGPQGFNGDKGNAGDTGPKGATGATGAQGPKGTTGNTGAAGPTGAKGDKGATGSKGDTGCQGDTGPGFANTVILSATRTYGPSTNYKGGTAVDTQAAFIPPSLKVTAGSQGTGAAYLEFGDTKCTYQGNNQALTANPAYVFVSCKKGDTVQAGMVPGKAFAFEGGITLSVGDGASDSTPTQILAFIQVQ